MRRSTGGAYTAALRALITVLRERPLRGILDATRPVRLSIREQRDVDLVLRFGPYRAALSTLAATLRKHHRISAREAGRVLARLLPGVPVTVTGADRQCRRVRCTTLRKTPPATWTREISTQGWELL